MRLASFILASTLCHYVVLARFDTELSPPTLSLTSDNAPLQISIAMRPAKRASLLPTEPPKPETKPIPKPVQKKGPAKKAPPVKPQAKARKAESYTSQPEQTPKMVNTADYLRNRSPTYPERARRKRHEGTVLLMVEVGASGKPGKIAIHKSSGYLELDTAAKKAVQSWLFTPALSDGKPVSSTVLVPINFKLRS